MWYVSKDSTGWPLCSTSAAHFMFSPPDKCFGEQALGTSVLCCLTSFWKPLLNLESWLWPELEQPVMDSRCSRNVCWVVTYFNEWMDPFSGGILRV